MISRAPAVIALACLGLLSALLLYASARPLFTDDAWWHLAHGEAYIEQGPWLDSDPLLFAAPGPPAPASWLFDVGLFGIWQTTGFAGLRIFHALAVISILGLAYQLLRRTSDSTTFAAFGTAAFGVLSAYRLFQLRPELITIAATLVLYGWLVAPRRDRKTLHLGVLAIVLGAVWANLHAGFVLAPILLSSSAIGMAGALLMNGSQAIEPGGGSRVRQLSAISIASAIGNLCNPSGYKALLAYLHSGDSTPTLTSVYDEWAPLQLLHLPLREMTPAPVDWMLLWGLLLGTLAGVIWWTLRGRNSESGARELDPALIAMTCASWIAMAIAVRFIWMAIFPILLLGQILKARSTTFDPAAWWRNAYFALATALLIPGFLSWGVWSFIARGVPKTLEGYSTPYAIGKHPGHAVWFLNDADLVGNLFAPYASGGFLGFWLAPEVRVLVNGSLNVPPEAMQAYSALQQRRGEGNATFEETLARQDIDIFVGSGLPGYHPTRPRPFTTAHLDGARGWVPVFRSLSSSVWLRDHPGNKENFERVAHYYADAGVPFDRHQGFAIGRVLREAPGWSRRHGLAPSDLSALEREASAHDGGANTSALARLAQVRASLGQYSEALDIDARLLSLRPSDLGALQRRVWCLLHLDRGVEAAEIADQLSAFPPNAQNARLEAAARRYALESDPEKRAALAATLPLFSREQASRLARGFTPPEVRSASRRKDRPSSIRKSDSTRQSPQPSGSTEFSGDRQRRFPLQDAGAAGVPRLN